MMNIDIYNYGEGGFEGQKNNYGLENNKSHL